MKPGLERQSIAAASKRRSTRKVPKASASAAEKRPPSHVLVRQIGPDCVQLEIREVLPLAKAMRIAQALVGK